MTLTEFLLARIAEDEDRATRAAHRQIVARHFGPHDCPGNSVHTFYLNRLACPTLRDLAAIYVVHPDYQEEWRA